MLNEDIYIGILLHWIDAGYSAYCNLSSEKATPFKNMGSSVHWRGNRGAMRITQLSRNTPGTSDLKRKVKVLRSPANILPDPFMTLKARHPVMCLPASSPLNFRHIYVCSIFHFVTCMAVKIVSLPVTNISQG
jgi:hypothetical protein